jgi:DNA-binding response OmpR family regulator
VVSSFPARCDGVRILFVPGDLLVPELRESFLKRESIGVATAESWSDALAEVATFRPHLIVLRSELDGDSAVPFCQQLQRELRHHAPKLLLVTERLRADLGDTVDAASDAHLVGPLGVPQLLSTMAELLGLHRRRGPRVPIDVLVHTEGFSDEGAAVDSTLSTAIMLSEDSVLIEASRMLALGAEGRLQFFLPGMDERLLALAKVRVAVDEVVLLYVLEFLDLAPQHRAAIRRYVESQEKAA